MRCRICAVEYALSEMRLLRIARHMGDPRVAVQEDSGCGETPWRLIGGVG